MSVNKVTLLGRVGKDPEIRSTNGGAKIASFSLATSETWKKDGEKQEKTEWHSVVVFNEHLVKVVESYVKKGDQLYVEGQLQTRKWTDKDGKDRYSTEVVLQKFRGEISLIGGKGGGGGNVASDAGPSSARAAFDLDDDVPFLTRDSIW